MESIANPTKLLENNAERDAETAPSGSAEPPLPRRFERYTLLKRLARGGMGEVLLASSGGIEGAERPVVVKIIRREHEADRSFVARFLDEARIQAQLQHPGVAQILEATTDVQSRRRSPERHRWIPIERRRTDKRHAAQCCTVRKSAIAEVRH